MASLENVSPLPPVISSQALAATLHGCSRDDEIQRAFAAIAGRCGFDGLSYLIIADTAGMATLCQHWTSAGARWRTLYADRQLHVLDTRIRATRGRNVPIAWRTTTEAGRRSTAPFCTEAARFGIRSGVALAFDDARFGRVVLGWDSARESVECDPLQGQLAALALLGAFLHEAMLDHCRKTLAERPGPRLTERERECVSYAARGMTSADIGAKLGITERTVNFHFGNITAKLGVLNRAEAIVRALSLRVI